MEDQERHAKHVARDKRRFTTRFRLSLRGRQLQPVRYRQEDGLRIPLPLPWRQRPPGMER